MKPTQRDCALELRQLGLETLNVDEAYQRTLGKQLVNQIAGEFSWYAFDPILVGKRMDRSLWVVDGQTRYAVAELLGHVEIATRVFDSEGKRHEAEVFLKANTKRGVKSFDKWRAALCAEEPETVAISDMVRKAGFAVSYSHSWPNLRCVSKLRDAYNSGVLPECLTAIWRCWHGNSDALSEVIMGALYMFFEHFPGVDMYRCVDKWSKLSPTALFAESEAAKSATGGSRYRAGALSLMRKYNSGLRSRRLEW